MIDDAGGTIVKCGQKGFTLVEIVFVVVILSLMLSLLFYSITPNSRHKKLQIQCRNNLHQLYIALYQYETTYQTAPAYNEESAATTADGNLCAANLMRLYSCGLMPIWHSDMNFSLDVFRCPVASSGLWPKRRYAAADPATVRDDPDGAKYTSYNLTTCYDMNDPADKIVVADMPYSLGNVAASIHDETPAKIDRGPNCLFKDGAVRNVKNLCPEGSSERDLSPSGNIYRVDGGEGKGKDTCILGVGR